MILSERALNNSLPPAIDGVPIRLTGQPVDRHLEARFASPEKRVAFARIVDTQQTPDSRAAYRFNITHLITPQSNGRIHYWWFNSWDFALDDADADAFILQASEHASREDIDGLEAILRVMVGCGTADRPARAVDAARAVLARDARGVAASAAMTALARGRVGTVPVRTPRWHIDLRARAWLGVRRSRDRASRSRVTIG
ncbi:hypothetical protein DF039_30755 [Burkholderia cenocepacia]|nr:hypothetical protein DF039_30755 [Burkholderia cenocepacia]